MTSRYLRAIVFWSALLAQRSAHAETVTTETGIALRRVTIDERDTNLLLCSCAVLALMIHDGRVVETIHFRLRSAPNALSTCIRTPEPGTYVARWSVCPEGSDDRYEGEFSFTVGLVSASERTS